MADTKHCAGVIGLEECGVRLYPQAVVLVSAKGNPVMRWPKQGLEIEVDALVAQVVAEIEDAVN